MIALFARTRPTSRPAGPTAHAAAYPPQCQERQVTSRFALTVSLKTAIPWKLPLCPTPRSRSGSARSSSAWFPKAEQKVASLPLPFVHLNPKCCIVSSLTRLRPSPAASASARAGVRTGARNLPGRALRPRRLNAADSRVRKSSRLFLYRQRRSLLLSRLKRVTSTLQPIGLCFTRRGTPGETPQAPMATGIGPHGGHMVMGVGPREGHMVTGVVGPREASVTGRGRAGPRSLHGACAPAVRGPPGPHSPSPGPALSAATGRGRSCRWPDLGGVLSGVLHDTQ